MSCSTYIIQAFAILEKLKKNNAITANEELHLSFVAGWSVYTRILYFRIIFS